MGSPPRQDRRAERKKAMKATLAIILWALSIWTCWPSWAVTPETLWVGDSLAVLAPMRGVKFAYPGAATAGMTRRVDTIRSDVKYKRIVILSGTADHFAGKPIEKVREELGILADKLYERYGVTPIIIDPLTIAEIAQQADMSTDGIHLNEAGYVQLFSIMSIEDY